MPPATFRELPLSEQIDMEYPWEHLRIKATKGEVIARHNFALMCFKGEGGLIQSYEEAANWWRKDAEQGYPPSQFNMGLMYFQGRGVKVDCVQALKWLYMAGESGHQGPSSGSVVPTTSARALRSALTRRLNGSF